MVFTHHLTLVSEGTFHTHNVTDQVRSVISESGIQDGMVLVFYRHTTGVIIVGEHEAGMLVDLENVLETTAPVGHTYLHHLRGYDTNGAAHVRTTLLNVSVTLPVTAGDLDLGSYQEILVIDFDEGAKSRTLVVKVMGES